VQKIARFCLENGYQGFEYLYGLPGTVGGAVWQNSKWPRQQFAISQIIQSVSFLHQSGQRERFLSSDCQFGYGSSVFQKLPGLITEVEFKLNQTEPVDLKKIAQQTLDYRRQTQPLTELTAGCAFKNISEDQRCQFSLPTKSAGYLIEQAGLKNLQVGKMRISSVHANFVTNQGSGTSQDYQNLIKQIKQQVLTKFGVTLNEEINIIK
jgi:UDP-N-acetylmuramate dehydrogenase